MGNRRTAAETNEVQELRDAVVELKDHIRVLINVIDEVRDELQWLTRNGLPSVEPLPTVPVLKQMAADPCAGDWSERLVIARGDSQSRLGEPNHVADPPSPKPPPGNLF